MHSSDPQVVVMCGVSGSGKTHYALGLQARGYERLSADLIVWEQHAAELATMAPERLRQLFADAARQVEHRLGEMIDARRRVVVDATMCHRTRRDAIREICQARGVEPLLVYMRAPLPLLKQRLATRTGSGPDDQLVPDAMVDRYYAGFEAPGPDEHAVVVDQR